MVRILREGVFPYGYETIPSIETFHSAFNERDISKDGL